MRKIVLPTLMILASLSPTIVRAEDAAATKIVKAGIKAHGGEEALKKNKAGDYKMKGSMSVLGADLDYTGTLTYQLPDQFKLTLDTALMGQKLAIVQVGNGDKFKTTVNGQAQPLDDKTKDELRQNVASQEVSMLYPLLDAEKYTIKAGADAKLGDVECAVLTVEKKKGKSMKLYFDKKTSLLYATVRTALAPGSGDEVEEETTMTDYKDVDGVKVPMKLSVKHDGKPFMTTTFTDAKLSAKLDPKVFALDD